MCLQQVPSPTKRIEYYDPEKAAADREVLMKEKQLKHDLDEQVRYPDPVHLLSTNKTVCFRRQQQKPDSRRYNRAGQI